VDGGIWSQVAPIVLAIAALIVALRTKHQVSNHNIDLRQVGDQLDDAGLARLKVVEDLVDAGLARLKVVEDLVDDYLGRTKPPATTERNTP